MERRWLADHEAGHAVAWVVLNMSDRRGQPIRFVAIDREFDAGVMETEGDDLAFEHLTTVLGTPEEGEIRAAILFDALVYYAGAAAETKSRGGSREDGWNEYFNGGNWNTVQRWQWDFVRAQARLAWLSEDDVEALERDQLLAWERTWALVTTYWEAIRALGDVLLEKHEIYGEEVVEIIRRAIPFGEEQRTV